MAIGVTSGLRSPHHHLPLLSQDKISGPAEVIVQASVKMLYRLGVMPQKVPDLFPAVTIPGRGVYWDGLFSQNPPVRELPGLLCADQPPPVLTEPAPVEREIWLIRINPQTCAQEPKRMAAISDRRNELAGNLSLEQEIQFIQQINRFVQEGGLIEKRKNGVVVGRYEIIEIREIEPPSAAIEARGWTLDAASKLDRRKEFLEMLRQEGQTQGAAFLANWV